MTLLALSLLLATLAGFGGRLSWMLGLFSPFRFQLLLLCLIATLSLCLGRTYLHWRIGPGLAAALLGVIINGVLVAPAWIAAPQPVATGPSLTLFAVNLYHGNHQLNTRETAAPIADVLNQSQADVLLIQEVTVHRLGILRKVLTNYHWVTGTGRPDAFGIALFVKRDSPNSTGLPSHLQIESAREIDTTQGLVHIKQVELRARFHGQPLSLLGMHTISAVHARTDRYRTAMLLTAADWANQERQTGRAVVILGDLNATPWCAPFVDLLRLAQLSDSRQGLGLQPSWPSRWPSLLRIPIDHCLHSSELITRQRTVLVQDLGSDHFPLVVTLQWR